MRCHLASRRRMTRPVWGEMGAQAKNRALEPQPSLDRLSIGGGSRALTSLPWLQAETELDMGAIRPT